MEFYQAMCLLHSNVCCSIGGHRGGRKNTEVIPECPNFSPLATPTQKDPKIGWKRKVL